MMKGKQWQIQNFLNFMQFLKKCVCWHLPVEEGLAPPSTGNPGSAPGKYKWNEFAY